MAKTDAERPSPPFPLTALLARAERTPNAPALIAGDEIWTAGRLAVELERLTRGLIALGVRAGDRVILHMANRPELVVAYCACFRLGAVAVPVNARFRSEELRAAVSRVRPSAYLGEVDLYSGVEPLGADVLAHDSRFLLGLDEDARGARPWQRLLARSAALVDGASPPDPDDAALLLATSGTTGESKLVIYTSRILAAVGQAAGERGIENGSTALVALPMMHASGVMCLAFGLCLGVPLVLVPTFDPDAVLDAIERHRCTWFAGLPFMAAQVARRQRERPRDLRSLRACCTGGDMCSSEVERAFLDTVGLPLLSFWASTEDLGAMGRGTQAGPFTRPARGTDVRLLDEDATPVADGEVGELLVRSPSTTPGYWAGPERVDPMPDGWFRSGDLFKRSQDGELRFAGRKKDLIVRGGSNISPVEIETAIMAQGDVLDVAVVGMPDHELGQRVGCALVLGEGFDRSKADGLFERLRARIADYKVPERYVVVQSIPRNAVGKIDRRAIARAIEDAAPGRIGC